MRSLQKKGGGPRPAKGKAVLEDPSEDRPYYVCSSPAAQKILYGSFAYVRSEK